MAGLIEAYRRLTFGRFLVEVMGLFKLKYTGRSQADAPCFVEAGHE
jgi:hypothetical protein